MWQGINDTALWGADPDFTGWPQTKMKHTGSSQERDQVVFNPVLPELISMTISSDEDSNQGLLKL